MYLYCILLAIFCDWEFKLHLIHFQDCLKQFNHSLKYNVASCLVSGPIQSCKHAISSEISFRDQCIHVPSRDSVYKLTSNTIAKMMPINWAKRKSSLQNYSRRCSSETTTNRPICIIMFRHDSSLGWFLLTGWIQLYFLRSEYLQAGAGAS